MRKNKISFIIVGGFLIFYLVKGIIEDLHAPCNVLKQFMNYSYSGIVIKKFIDGADHSTKKVIIKNFNQDYLDTLDLLDWDKTGVYYRIYINDTIIKKQGSNTLYLNNENGRSVYTLDFGCDKNH